MKLAINVNSWHYKLQSFLKQIWGMRDEEDPRSLCIYSQFLIWGSVFSFILSPFIIIGWLLLKINRLIYKYSCKTRIGKKIMTWGEDKIKYGYIIEESADYLEDCPALVCLIWTFGSLGLFTLFCTVLYMLEGILINGIPWLFIIAIPAIPTLLGRVLYAIGQAFILIGCGMFYFFGSLAWCVSWALVGLKIALISTGNFLLPLLPYIALFLISFCVVTLMGISVFYLINVFLHSPKTKKFRDWLTFKLNGFVDAKHDVDVKLKERKKKLKERKKEIEERKKERRAKYGPPMYMKIGKSILNGLSWTSIQIKDLFASENKVVTKDGKKFNLLGTWSLFINIIKSTKNGICPMIEFVEEDDLQKEEKGENK